MTTLYDNIQEALQFLRSQSQFQPEIGIVLGTGLGNLASEIQIEDRIPYQKIPHFPTSTVESHKGELIFGYLEGRRIVAMSGRFHYYEGYSMKEVTFPIRVLKFLGIEQLLISNASGGVNPHFQAGDIVLIRDHINLQPENPLRGMNDERLGPRFPDMLHTYDNNIINKLLAIAKEEEIKLHTGVYVGVQGPNLETPAEYRYFNRIGGDVIGMSTVPEVLVAKHMGLPLAVISVVSNQCFPISAIKETTLEEVIQVVEKAAPKVAKLVKRYCSLELKVSR